MGDGFGRNSLMCLAIGLGLALAGCSGGGGGDGDGDLDGDIDGGEGDADGDGDGDGDRDGDGDGDATPCVEDDECDDGFECTQDSCSDEGTCLREADPVHCRDLLGDDPCIDATCAPDDRAADPETGCVIAPRDGDPCTIDGTTYCFPSGICAEGECVLDGAVARDCDDGVECTVDSCDDEVASCVNRPDHDLCPDDPAGPVLICVPDALGADRRGCVVAERCEDSSTCNDHRDCNGLEACIDGICLPGEPMDCHDGMGCTADSCDELRGCVFTVRHTECGESGCTLHRCDPDNPEADAEGCIHEPRECASDGNPCTLDICQEGFGCNPPAPAGALCEEVFGCLEGETCDGDGLCDPDSGRPRGCDDDNACTLDTCAEPLGCRADPMPAGTLCGPPMPGCSERACVGGVCSERDTTTCRHELADDCCPAGCALASDLDCLGRGQIVLLGHDLDARSPDIDRLVGNSILMTRPAEVRVLAYSEHSDPGDILSEPVNTNRGIDARAAKLGRTWRRTDLTRSADLAGLLPGQDVLLVYEQELITEAQALAVGAAWRDRLSDFVREGGTVVLMEDTGYTWALGEAAGLFDIVRAGGVSAGSVIDLATPGSPLTLDMPENYGATEGSGTVWVQGAATWVYLFEGDFPVVSQIQRPPPALSSWIDAVAGGHPLRALSRGTQDDGQFDIDLAPLSFPFNGAEQGCAAVSTNGYLRFGPAGACPEASSAAAAETDIDAAFTRGTGQISWLAGDGSIPGEIHALVDAESARVVLTILGYRRPGAAGRNDVQIVLDCDTGNVQVSYRTITFDFVGHWSLGVSEPSGFAAAYQAHNFLNQWPGTLRWFGPGAVGLAPYPVAGDEGYEALEGQAITYESVGDQWRVLVGSLPSGG